MPPPAERPRGRLRFSSSNCGLAIGRFRLTPSANRSLLWLIWPRRCRGRRCRWSLACYRAGRGLGFLGHFFICLIVKGGTPSFEVLPGSRCDLQLVEFLVQVTEQKFHISRLALTTGSCERLEAFLACISFSSACCLACSASPACARAVRVEPRRHGRFCSDRTY